MQQVASSAPRPLPWTLLASIASIESQVGKTADQFFVGRRLRLRTVPRGHLADLWRRNPPARERSRRAGKADHRAPGLENFHYALPAMARYLCAEGAGQDLRKAIFAYNHADWHVAEVVQLAARYGGIGASGGGLIDGWADRPPLNQYDRHNSRSD